MAKEILLYTGINTYTVAGIIDALNANMKKPVTMRVNSYGGDAMASWGMYDKVRDHGDVTVQVDGAAMSGAGNLLFFAKKVVALDVANILFHRAASYGDDETSKQLVTNVNASLKARMIAKVDAVKFKAITGFTIDEMFSMDDRKNILLTAQQAKDIGIVDEIKVLTPDIRTEIEVYQQDWNFKVAAEGSSNPNQNTMTVEKLKTEFPAVYASIFESGKADGVKAGIIEERERVQAWTAFALVDAEAVKKGVAEGKPMTMAIMAEMTAKGLSKKTVKDAEDDSGKDVITNAEIETPEAKTKKEKEISDFIKNVDTELVRTRAKEKKEEKKVK